MKNIDKKVKEGFSVVSTFKRTEWKEAQDIWGTMLEDRKIDISEKDALASAMSAKIQNLSSEEKEKNVEEIDKIYEQIDKIQNEYANRSKRKEFGKK